MPCTSCSTKASRLEDTSSSDARLSTRFNSRAIEFQIPLPPSDNAVLEVVLKEQFAFGRKFVDDVHCYAFLAFARNLFVASKRSLANSLRPKCPCASVWWPTASGALTIAEPLVFLIATLMSSHIPTRARGYFVNGHYLLPLSRTIHRISQPPARD
jgi:hypothetical protein